MNGDPNSLIKLRDIRFCALRPDNQAHDASLFLRELEGVYEADPVNPRYLQVRYDLTYITLHIIEASLTELGFHLDSSLMCKLRRALYQYTEETQRANLGLEDGTDTSVQVFVNRYQRLRHGCRDGRPEHWRRYS
jgi:hypothetical protein